MLWPRISTLFILFSYFLAKSFICMFQLFYDHKSVFHLHIWVFRSHISLFYDYEFLFFLHVLSILWPWVSILLSCFCQYFDHKLILLFASFKCFVTMSLYFVHTFLPFSQTSSSLACITICSHELVFCYHVFVTLWPLIRTLFTCFKFFGTVRQCFVQRFLFFSYTLGLHQLVLTMCFHEFIFFVLLFISLFCFIYSLSLVVRCVCGPNHLKEPHRCTICSYGVANFQKMLWPERLII